MTYADVFHRGDEIDLSTIKKGDSGKTVTDEDFAAVTFFSLWDNKNAMEAYRKTENPDKWAVKSLSELGYTKEQAEGIVLAQGRNWYTADLFIVPPRDNEGRYFKEVTNPGRRDTKDAFREYKAGNKEKLAGIIAQGINKAAEDMIVANDNASTTVQHKGIMACTARIVELMKDDPELEKLALPAEEQPQPVSV